MSANRGSQHGPSVTSCVLTWCRVCSQLSRLRALDQSGSLSSASELQGQEVTVLQEVKQMPYVKEKYECNITAFSNVSFPQPHKKQTQKQDSGKVGQRVGGDDRSQR